LGTTENVEQQKHEPAKSTRHFPLVFEVEPDVSDTACLCSRCV